MAEVANRKCTEKTNVKSVGSSGYERRNRKVFKRCLKTGSDGAEVMSSGSSFQMLASATGSGNDRLPNVIYGDRTVQSNGWSEEADLNQCRLVNSESVCYCI